MVSSGRRAHVSNPPDETAAILYVDEDRETASAVVGALEATEDGESRFTVAVEDDPETALERVGSESFDAVVADYDLPTMDGVELLRAVRRTRSRLPFVLFTDGRSESVASEAISAGVTDYLRKRTDDEGLEALSDRLWSAVTEYRAVLAAERASRLVDALTESSIVFRAYITPDGTVEHVDETTTGITGVPAERCVGERIWALPWWVDDDASVVRSHVERAAAGDHTRFRIQYDADGETGIALCVLFPVRSEEAVESVLFVGQDVTDWARHERLLERQNQRLDEFTSVVSHDLRSPLAVASGHLELIRAKCDSDHLEHLERALVHMDRLIVDLQTLARQGQDIGTLDTVDLLDLVRRCWTNVQTGDARLAIEGELTFRADRSRVGQLFENLIRNSVEHGSTDGLAAGDDAGEPLTVTVGPLPGGDGFFVEDDGPGIPPDERESVFEAGHSTAEDGTGFGLRIVEGIVEAHGWDVSVVTGRAGGARFEITGVDGEIE